MVPPVLMCCHRRCWPQVYATADVLEASAGVHCPRLEMGSRSKLSCVVWNAYMKRLLLAADYEGSLSLWDAEVAACTATYEEHAKRVWSCDFSRVRLEGRPPRKTDGCSGQEWLFIQATHRRRCLPSAPSLPSKVACTAGSCGELAAPFHLHLNPWPEQRACRRLLGDDAKKQDLWRLCAQTDPTRFVSGSDDGTVRLWSVRDEAPVAAIDAKANVCSVQLSPLSSHPAGLRQRQLPRLPLRPAPPPGMRAPMPDLAHATSLGLLLDVFMRSTLPTAYVGSSS